MFRFVFILNTSKILSLNIIWIQYLDPGTGSIIYQLIIAALALIIFYFSKIKKIVYRLLKKEKSEDDQL